MQKLIERLSQKIVTEQSTAPMGSLEYILDLTLKTNGAYQSVIDALSYPEAYFQNSEYLSSNGLFLPKGHAIHMNKYLSFLSSKLTLMHRLDDSYILLVQTALIVKPTGNDRTFTRSKNKTDLKVAYRVDGDDFEPWVYCEFKDNYRLDFEMAQVGTTSQRYRKIPFITREAMLSHTLSGYLTRYCISELDHKHDPNDIFNITDKITLFSPQAICNLAEYMANNRLTTEKAYWFIYQILWQVKELHDKGLVHQDIRPENILVYPNSKVKLADFDLVAQHGSTYRLAEGSYNYASPEVFLAHLTVNSPNNQYYSQNDYNCYGKQEALEYWTTEIAKNAIFKYSNPSQSEYFALMFPNKANDIYSLGLVFYKMLFGKYPNYKSEVDNKIISGHNLLKGLLTVRQWRFNIDMARFVVYNICMKNSYITLNKNNFVEEVKKPKPIIFNGHRPNYSAKKRKNIEETPKNPEEFERRKKCNTHIANLRPKV